eukprot:s5021_g4.t1
MADMKEMTILQPDDFHHHFRDEPYLEHTVPHAVAQFCRVLVMPNLVPPVTSTAAALAYRERILLRVPKDVRPEDFVPLMTLYLTDKTSPEEIVKAKESGHVYAVKLYPAGATTNSDFGVTDYEKIMPALKKMEEVGLLLLVHGESTDQSIDIFEREQSFYETVMPMLLSRCPKLRVVCEHITSAMAARFVETAGPNVAATITAHHLCHNRNAIFKGGINPHYYCLPILKKESDRLKLLQCAVDNPKYFLGTDSAPHGVDKKECPCGCAGCFTAHMAVELVAESFEAIGRLDALEDFVSKRGAAFYGLPENAGKRVLVREAWKVPEQSYMRWKTWRKPSGGGDDGRFDWTTGDDELADIRNSLRLLARGFLCLSAEEASMMSCYADAMVNRGGLPIYQLPLPRADLEERLPSDYHVAAVDCSVVPHLPLHLQAALRKPPLCESTNLKDLHLRNLRFFIEQTQFNIRHQKDLKLRGGYIAAGDMERIINYMDEEHFAAGRDLAEARALPDDSDLQKSNAEGFTSEEECHLQSDRCRHLRTTLESVQRFMLAESPKPATPTARRSGGKKSSLESVLVVNDGSSRLDGFLSLFGASREVKVAADRKDGQTLRVTCARTDRLDQPLLIQRAHRSQGQAGDRDEAFQEVDETSLREAAARAYCKSFADSKCSLPWPPMGFIWTVSGAVQLRAESGSAAEALRFFVAGVELPPFDAGPALYIDCLDSRPGDQVKLLAQLRSVAETLRSSPAEDAAPEWLEEAVASKIPGCIWQEIYARLLLEEDFEGNPCLTLSPAHPYAGTLFRIVLLLAFLYPWAPSSNDLAFRITRSSDISGSLHQHLLTVVKTLAYSDAESRLSLAKPKALEAKVTTELFPYQKEAVERLLQSRHKGSNGSLDASSLGAGKTLVAVSFCMFLASAHGGGQFLVLVASSSLMEGWRDQLIQHTSGVRIQLQQENGVLRDVSQRGSNQATTSPGKTSPGKRKRSVQDTDTEALFVITTYARAARHPFCCTWLLVVADECLALQNTDTLQCTAAWRLVSRSLYGGHFISGTMFRRHYSDLLDMLKMLRSSIPLRAEFVQAYFGAYLISYMRPQRSWQTKLVPLDIPAAVQSSYLEVLDECRGRGAQNFVKVLSRMRRVLSTAVQNDARPLAEAVWQTVRQLRQEGRRPLVFASTEREADALVRHLGCARRYRRRHPVHCRGCDICRNFNKFAQPGCEKLPPVEGSEKGEELLIFTVGSDAAGLNLQSLGDSLILRPVQMDQLVQMMGRLDRPGQTSEQLCRAILYMKRTHEEAEVAHLQKHAAFWSLHIKPIARLIVMATAGAADNRQEVSERYDKLLEGEQKPKAAASLEIAEAPEGEAVANSEAWTSLENFGKRSWSTLRLAAEGPWPLSGPGLKSSPAKHSFSKLAFRQVRGDLPDSSPKLSTIDLEPPMDVEQQLPRAMTRQSVQLGVGYLIQNDERFRHVVQLIGPPTGILELLGKDRPDPFTTLVQTVCHQQLSVRVCQGMFERLLGLCGNRDTKVLQPERVAVESCDRIREVAKLSYRKIEYIQKIAHRFLDGTLSGEVFEEASDDELRHRLTELPGIGEWTLEMFLIFQLHRHGGIPYGDVAIQSAMKMIYNIVPPAHITAKNEVSWMPTRPQMEIFAKRWGPFGSIASLYMLRVADNVNAVFLPD